MKCAWCGEKIEGDMDKVDDNLVMHPECYVEYWDTDVWYYEDIELYSQDRPEDRE